MAKQCGIRWSIGWSYAISYKYCK